jgi:hypothetical protein
MLVSDDMSLAKPCSDSRPLKAKQFVRRNHARSAMSSSYRSNSRVWLRLCSLEWVNVTPLSFRDFDSRFLWRSRGVRPASQGIVLRNRRVSAIARSRRPMAAVNLSVSADMIVKTKPRGSTRNQSADRHPTS